MSWPSQLSLLLCYFHKGDNWICLKSFDCEIQILKFNNFKLFWYWLKLWTILYIMH